MADVVGTKKRVPQASRPDVSDIFDAMNICDDSVIVFDSNWRYVFVNRKGWQTLDRPKTEVLGRNVWKLMPHLKGTKFETAARQAMKLQKKAEIEEYYPHRQQYFRTKFYPSKNFLMMQITDITDLVKAQEINSQLMGDLRQAMEVYWSEDNRHRREESALKPPPKKD